MLRNKYYKYSIEINIKQIANNLIIYNVRENICKIFTQTFKSLDIMQQLFHNIIIQKNIYIYIIKKLAIEHLSLVDSAPNLCD